MLKAPSILGIRVAVGKGAAQFIFVYFILLVKSYIPVPLILKPVFFKKNRTFGA